MLFKVYLQDKDETNLGFDWIEVLAITPFRAVIDGHTEMKCSKCHHEEPWSSISMIESEFYCRTEIGLMRIEKDDLDFEIEMGFYCEQGQEEEAQKKIASYKKYQARAKRPRKKRETMKESVQNY